MVWANLTKVLNGIDDPDFSRYILSPFDKVLTADEASGAEFDFFRYAPNIQQEMREDFRAFLEWLGGGYVFAYADTGLPGTESSETSEVFVDIKISRKSPAYLLDDFLSGGRQETLIHLEREMIVTIGFDLSIQIVCQGELIYPNALKALKLVCLKRAAALKV